MQTMKNKNAAYLQVCREKDIKNNQNKKECNEHIELLKQLLLAKNETGQYSEYSNMLTSHSVYKQYKCSDAENN